MAALVDTNILVHRFDPRFPGKQATATEWLRRGVSTDAIRVPHRALVEFVAAVTRSPGGQPALLSRADAVREAEDMLAQFGVLYPTDQLSWFDAHMRAYAEHFGLAELWSEDFHDGRLYGSVRAVNPFAA